MVHREPPARSLHGDTPSVRGRAEHARDTGRLRHDVAVTLLVRGTDDQGRRHADEHALVRLQVRRRGGGVLRRVQRRRRGTSQSPVTVAPSG